MTSSTRPGPAPNRVRLVAAGLATAAPLLALLAARAAWGDSVPGTVATHWSGVEPDGFTSGATFFVITLAACLLSTAVAALVVVRASSAGHDADAALWLPGTALVSWVAASTCITSVALTMRAGRPEDAHLSWWILIPLLGVPWAIGTFLLTPRGPATSYGPAPQLDTPIAPGETAVWISHARGRWAGALVVAMVVTALVTAFLGRPWMVVLFAVLAILAAAFASITVHVDRRGLWLSSWGLRWRTIRLDDIDSAEVAHLRPVEWGGYGYRLSPRGTAVIVRGGDGLALRRRGGGVFAVSVDDPGTGAALLNSLVAAERNA
ncbi:hypothetical protein G4H71_20645 [Rhodococcus triatomae]|uniref:DUF1648 domain-containing protein n=1 Tax=Rhodococcus triatomae TaxID=300028 RepID=A0A1G8KKY0_9NOCA|nr:hypothetical protein [Rhodococcus triatomae]QNG18958.1 hypothetical protein G4H72_09735 [Rhodococcus triatomae]QNG25128.1 hypothetical protein G4H71_20645 [Rhodococcus triatomae]SDI44113.1 hypothetical protein SAMN05444695_107180 [Rhodococcus triatomae]